MKWKIGDKVKLRKNIPNYIHIVLDCGFEMDETYIIYNVMCLANKILIVVEGNTATVNEFYFEKIATVGFLIE